MAAYTDGTIIKGGFTITLDTAGLTVIVDTCSAGKPSKVITRTDENDAPAAQLVYDDWETCNMTIQINATAARGDFRGDTFTTSSIDGTSKKYVIVSQTDAVNKSATVTYDITCNRCYN